jgi:hypothetical protein
MVQGTTAVIAAVYGPATPRFSRKEKISGAHIEVRDTTTPVPSQVIMCTIQPITRNSPFGRLTAPLHDSGDMPAQPRHADIPGPGA